MAAAVYLHNALFGQPSSRTQGLTHDDDEGSASPTTSTTDESSEDVEGEQQVPPTTTTTRRLHSGSSRAPSSSSPALTTQTQTQTHRGMADPHVHIDQHARTHSVSSQSTLVPASPLPWQHQQQHQRWYHTPGPMPVHNNNNNNNNNQESYPLDTVDLSSDRDDTTTQTGTNPTRHHHDHHTPSHHHHDLPATTAISTDQPPSPPAPSPTSSSSAALPPGLPAATSRTSELARGGRPLTPYPFPPLPPPTSEGSEPRPARSSTSTRKGSGRPKGKRRRREEEEEEEGRAEGRAEERIPPGQNHPRNSNSGGRRRAYFPPYLRGRIPNKAFSRRARIMILAVRFLLALVLSGWAAYSCARYWLAYLEFRPAGNNNPPNNAVEDPPRSLYAFVLAITCTLATALLVLDSAYFLYFVLYPHDGRLLMRIPTLGPISRNATDAAAAPEDAVDEVEAEAIPPARPRPPRVPVQLQDDKFTSMPARNSGFSTNSGYRRSRRLSKPRPESWLATYPPGGNEGDYAAVEDRDQDAARVRAGNEGADGNEEVDTRQRRQEEHVEPATAAQEPFHNTPAPPSRYVEPTPLVTGEESDPQVEKHSKRTYTLHLPSLCHEPSISPLPFPPSHTSHRNDTQHVDPPRRTRKWRRTRVFLHLIHWLAFIAINIPGFVNVALVPTWYQPEQTFDPSNNGVNSTTGINSPHRLAGLCTYSPDVLWAGTALPPAYPPPCAQTIPYRIWLWGAIGRVLVTFVLSLLFIAMDGVWWGAWVVGTRRIGWQGALGGPWRPRRSPRSEQQQEPEEDSEVPETSWAKRIRLLSGASKASGRSGRSGRSNKEKVGELGAPTASERGSSVAPAVSASAAIGTAAIGVAGGITSFGVDPQDAISAPIHKVRRKPVSRISPPSSSSNSPPTATYSLNSPPPSVYGPGVNASYFEQSKLAGGGVSSRRPSVQDSIGGSTVVGSPPGTSYLPSSPAFIPVSPPASSSYHGATSADEHTSFGNAGRRSMGLERVPEQEPRSSDEREGEENSPQIERQYPDRPQSRLARYDDPAAFGNQYRPGAHSPPSPSSPTYPPSPTRPGWRPDPNVFSPTTSPGADSPLLGRGYFMVGDGGFSAGNANDGAYDEDSYYSAMEGQSIPPRAPVTPSNANRATSPTSERSNSPNSYGHGHYAGVDVRVETPPHGADEEDSPELPRLVPATSQWYPAPSSTVSAYQHPLAQGIQIAMGQPPEFEREVRMLGTVVRRMSTIESFGSHERELSRRGSAATARTGRGNSAGTAQREGTNGSGNSAPVPTGSGNGSVDRNTSGSGGQVERTTETGPAVGFVRASSPTDMSPIEQPR